MGVCGATWQPSLQTGTEEGLSSSRPVWARQPDIAFKTKVKENLFGASKLTHLEKAPAASLKTRKVKPELERQLLQRTQHPILVLLVFLETARMWYTDIHAGKAQSTKCVCEGQGC